jgi:hypothetical protein
MFCGCTPNTCAMLLIENVVALIVVIKIACLVTCFVFEFANFVSCNETHIPGHYLLGCYNNLL